MIDSLALATAILAPIGFAPLMPPVPPAPLMVPQRATCQSGERVLFQCAMGSRNVAICAGGEGRARYVQYRFGGASRIELEYPQRRSGTGTLAYASTPYSGGGEAQIHFRNGAYTYVVYSRTVRTGFGKEGNRPEFSAGLFVKRDGRVLSQRSCTAPRDASIDLAAAQRVLPEGDFIDDN